MFDLENMAKLKRDLYKGKEGCSTSLGLSTLTGQAKYRLNPLRLNQSEKIKDL